jgi:hypothetical protein
MSNLNRKEIIFLNCVLIVVGLGIVAYGLVLMATPSLSLPGGLLNAFGTTMAVTGSITLIDRLLTEKPSPPPVALQRVVMKRKLMAKSIHNRKKTAMKVDILGISLTDLLKEIISDPKKGLVHKVLYDPECRLRFIFMHPKAPFLLERSAEDGNYDPAIVLKRQTESIETCVRLYTILEKKRRAEQRRNQNFEPRGSITVKLIEACPYISYERYDFDIYWGLYTADTSGREAPVFLTNSADNLMYAKLKDHFKTLLDGGYEYLPRPVKNAGADHNFLLRVNHQEVWLNEHLANDLLGEARVAKLTKGLA